METHTDEWISLHDASFRLLSSSLLSYRIRIHWNSHTTRLVFIRRVRWENLDWFSSRFFFFFSKTPLYRCSYLSRRKLFPRWCYFLLFFDYTKLTKDLFKGYSHSSMRPAKWFNFYRFPFSRQRRVE